MDGLIGSYQPTTHHSPLANPTLIFQPLTHPPTHGLRQVAVELGYEDVQGSDLQLISFHSVSKGFIGECGIRGGYFELFGIDDDVKVTRMQPLYTPNNEKEWNE